MNDADEMLTERFELVSERIDGICSELNTGSCALMGDGFKQWFSQMASWMQEVNALYHWLCEHDFDERSEAMWAALNEKLYSPIHEMYNTCPANPDYSESVLGVDFGAPASMLASEIYRVIPDVMRLKIGGVTALWELFTEFYTTTVLDFSEHVTPKASQLQKMIYWYVMDYTEMMVKHRLSDQLIPGHSGLDKIIEEVSLDNNKYLYRFGLYVSDIDKKSAEFIRNLSQEKVEKIADTFAEGYIRGFKTMGISLEGKKYVMVRGYLGFERIFREAAKKFRAKGLEPVWFFSDTGIVNRRQVPIGYHGKHVNPQFDFDHAQDKASYYDGDTANRYLEALKKIYTKLAPYAKAQAGPACFETFGETPFTPVKCEKGYSMSAKQRKIENETTSAASTIVDQYMKGDEISFTIIAFPTPEIGEQYPEIFDEILRCNTLDNEVYREVQQHLVDALDRGKYVYVRGKAPNKTSMKVMLRPISEPKKETIFENCLADVNIPLGEVFTSPMLLGTNGLLHATDIYLNGIRYKQLKLYFSDGKITDYSCENTGNVTGDKRLIEDRLLFGHSTLPIGEFAIGTNTIAYAAAKKYNMIEKLPILIVEKTGPHFAIGDTCYARAEDHKVYNPDGKEIISRENEISARRNEEGFNAYFNCHTDITIPFDEISEIMIVDDEENMTPIIIDGRFVLQGTELLNEALD